MLTTGAIPVTVVTKKWSLWLFARSSVKAPLARWRINTRSSVLSAYSRGVSWPSGTSSKKNSSSLSVGEETTEYARSMTLAPSSTPRVTYWPGSKEMGLSGAMRTDQRSGP